MIDSKEIKVIELRNYLMKPGARDSFIDYFETHFTGSQDVLGGYVLGQFRIKGLADRFFWIRGFADMASRSSFLPAFYGGPAWKEFGPAANDMMLEWHNVHLLRPLKTGVTSNGFAGKKGLLIVDYYLAREGKLDALTDFFQAEYLPFLKASGIDEPTLWVSEMQENDFPRLPVIQDKSSLVSLTYFDDEADYQLKLQQTHFNSFGSKSPMQELVRSKESLVLYSTNAVNG